MMRARRREADLQHIMCPAPRVKNGAAAARAVRVDQVRDRRDNVRLCQGFDDK
jgi:hypothetical protein